jgi:hypothetical protein
MEVFFFFGEYKGVAGDKLVELELSYCQKLIEKCQKVKTFE